VKNSVDTAQALQGALAHQAVGIGDKTDHQGVTSRADKRLPCL
jgi:hypothetical protein